MSSVREKSKRNPKDANHTNNTHRVQRTIEAPLPPPLTSSFAYTTAIRTNTNTNSSRVDPAVVHVIANHTNTQPRASTASIDISPSTLNGTATKNEDTPTNTSNLFSFAQVTQLLLSSINKLKQCKTKMDQITIIAELLQYACD